MSNWIAHLDFIQVRDYLIGFILIFVFFRYALPHIIIFFLKKEDSERENLQLDVLIRQKERELKQFAATPGTTLASMEAVQNTATNLSTPPSSVSPALKLVALYAKDQLPFYQELAKKIQWDKNFLQQKYQESISSRYQQGKNPLVVPAFELSLEFFHELLLNQKLMNAHRFFQWDLVVDLLLYHRFLQALARNEKLSGAGLFPVHFYLWALMYLYHQKIPTPFPKQWQLDYLNDYEHFESQAFKLLQELQNPSHDFTASALNWWQALHLLTYQISFILPLDSNQWEKIIAADLSHKNFQRLAKKYHPDMIGLSLIDPSFHAEYSKVIHDNYQALQKFFDV